MNLQGDRVVMVDCDDTLVMWDLSKYPSLPRVDVECYGPVQVIINEKNVHLIQKLKKMGYRIVVWSQTGAAWADTVVRACGLSDCVDITMSKPRFYIDDLPSHEWMGERVWRDPETGQSSWGDNNE